jgi:hypothetical protein
MRYTFCTKKILKIILDSMDGTLYITLKLTGKLSLKYLLVEPSIKLFLDWDF